MVQGARFRLVSSPVRSCTGGHPKGGAAGFAGHENRDGWRREVGGAGTRSTCCAPLRAPTACAVHPWFSCGWRWPSSNSSTGPGPWTSSSRPDLAIRRLRGPRRDGGQGRKARPRAALAEPIDAPSEVGREGRLIGSIRFHVLAPPPVVDEIGCPSVTATVLLDRLFNPAGVIRFEGVGRRLHNHADLIPDHVRATAPITPPPPPKGWGRPGKNCPIDA